MIAAMDVPERHMVASHLARVWRRGAACRPSLVLRDCPPGSIRHEPGKPPGEFPSDASTRLMWAQGDRPITQVHIDAARVALKDLGVSRAYVWLSPLLHTPATESLLTASGLFAWPHVEYPALVRRAEPLHSGRGREFEVRVISLEEAPGVLAATSSWYGPGGTPAAMEGIRSGFAEFHAAFAGGTPVAISALIPDGEFAYLGWMGTDPKFQGKGAQAALIASRVTRAHDLGTRWCSSETNTAIPKSLRNLERSGFEIALNWLVYRWDI